MSVPGSSTGGRAAAATAATAARLPPDGPTGPVADAGLSAGAAEHSSLEGPGGRLFTREQAAAIERRDGDLLLSAGAGSGKTSVMVERFVRAVREDGAAVAEILAITFTEKAAAELRERIRRRFLELGDSAHARDAELSPVGTIHGFCHRLLSMHALAAGLDPDFEVLDAPLARRLSRAAFEQALDALLANGGEQELGCAAAYGEQELRASVLGALEELRGRGAEVALAAPAAGGAERDALAALDVFDRLLRATAARYAEAKRARGALDFGDLELLARDLLLERPDLRELVAGRYRHVMVDEYQDTNPLQVEILALISRGNQFAVGDELQSIYGFRGADVEGFRRRRAELEPRGRTATLSVSFRAGEELLDVLDAAFAPCFEPGFIPLRAAPREGEDAAPTTSAADAPPAAEPGRAAEPRQVEDPRVELLLTESKGWDGDPQAESEAPEAEPVDLGDTLPDRTPLWRRAEARLLAQRIGELVDDGHVPHEIAVLCRAAGDIAVYERAIQDQGIETHVAGGRGYWAQREVRDVLAYLAVLANPLDEQRLYELLASPFAGLSSDGLALIALRRREARASVWEALADERLHAALERPERERLTALLELLRAERGALAWRSLEGLIEHGVRAAGYDLRVLAQPAGERRFANVRKVMAIARRHEAQNGRDLRGLLDELAALAAEDPQRAEEGQAPLGGEGAVSLMTIHKAKGLEFPVVCVADLGRGRRAGGEPALLIGDDGAVGLRLQRLGVEERTPAFDYEQIKQQREQAGAEEERRLFYVACTRARERLILSGGASRDRKDRLSKGTPLAWIAPAFGLRERAAADTGGGEAGARGAGPPSAAPRAEPDAAHPLVELPLRWNGRARAVACSLNSRATLGSVLREESLAPAGGRGRRRPVRAAPGAGDASAGAASEPEPGPASAPGGTSGPTSASAVAPAPAAVAPPPPPVPIERLSYSALGLYESCGYRYYVERVLSLPRDERSAPARGGQAALPGRVRGTIVHRLLERIDLAAPAAADPAEIRTLAAAEGAAATDADCESIAALVAGFAASPLAARLAAARDAHRELPFAFALPDEGPLVRGFIDVLAWEGEERDSALVVDYKTDRLDGADPASVAERGYSLQRIVYALAALRAGARAVEVVHCFLERPAEPVSVRYEAAAERELERRLGERAAALLAGEFPVSSAPDRLRCDGCPARGTLCSHPRADTERPRAALAA